MTFDAIGIAGTGLTLHQKWLDAISDNLANADNASATSGPAFQARYVQAQAGAGTSGAYVAGMAYGDPNGVVVNDPSNPLADAQGNVRMPDVNVGEQMGELIMAQRGYQANAAVVDRARQTYEAALQIGK